MASLCQYSNKPGCNGRNKLSCLCLQKGGKRYKLQAGRSPSDLVSSSKSCSFFGHNFSTFFILTECPFIIFNCCFFHPADCMKPPCLSRSSSSLGESLSSCLWRGGNMAASAPGCQQGEEVKEGEREAPAFVGKRNKELGKRKESNTCTPTSMGLLQLGPQRNYLTWRPAKASQAKSLCTCAKCCQNCWDHEQSGLWQRISSRTEKGKRKPQPRGRAGTEWAYFHTTAIVLLMRKGN